MTPISPADPRRPTIKRLEGRSVSGARSFSDAITADSAAQLAAVGRVVVEMRS
jgi:hypothetical protein